MRASSFPVLARSVGSSGAGEEWREQPGESSGKWLGELVSGKDSMISRGERVWRRLSFGGVGLEGRRELRPVLGRLGREQGRQALATSASPAQEGKGNGGALDLWLDSLSPTSSLTVLLSVLTNCLVAPVSTQF